MGCIASGNKDFDDAKTENKSDDETKSPPQGKAESALTKKPSPQLPISSGEEQALSKIILNCWCGECSMEINADKNLGASYCHCKSCRTKKMTLISFDIQFLPNDIKILKGKQEGTLTTYKHDGTKIVTFCNKCNFYFYNTSRFGPLVMNGNAFLNHDKNSKEYAKVPIQFKPSVHVNCESVLYPSLLTMNDNLPKFFDFATELGGNNKILNDTDINNMINTYNNTQVVSEAKSENKEEKAKEKEEEEEIQVLNCFCGKCSISINVDKNLGSGYCHCKNCRRLKMTLISSVIQFLPNDIKILKGKNEGIMKTYSHSPTRIVTFCSNCNYWFYITSAAGPLVMKTMAFLNNDKNSINYAKLPKKFAPQYHINCESVLYPYITTIKDNLPKFMDYPKEIGGTGIMVDDNDNNNKTNDTTN